MFDEDEVEVDTWPGFVDVLASVVMFLLLGFVMLVVNQAAQQQDEVQADADKALAEVAPVADRLNGALLAAANVELGRHPDDCVQQGWEVVCVFRESLRFGTARWAIESEEGRHTLLGFAAELRKLCDEGKVKRVIVEGHTDPVNMNPSQNRDMTNWELSSARAGHVVRYLQGSGGIPGELLEAVGHADTRAPDEDPDAPYERWRRVTIRVHLKGSIFDGDSAGPYAEAESR